MGECGHGILEPMAMGELSGVLDGKHVTVACPDRTGSLFFNYKGSFSVVLLALVDADYNFLYIDVGSEGRFASRIAIKSSLLTIFSQLL